MSKILCTGLFLLFCGLAAECLRCKVCFRFLRYMPCTSPGTCVAKPGQSCVTVHLKFKGHFHVEIRNCSSKGSRDCKPNVEYAKPDLEIKRSCCRKDLCNS